MDKSRDLPRLTIYRPAIHHDISLLGPTYPSPKRFAMLRIARAGRCPQPSNHECLLSAYLSDRKVENAF